MLLSIPVPPIFIPAFSLFIEAPWDRVCLTSFLPFPALTILPILSPCGGRNVNRNESLQPHDQRGPPSLFLQYFTPGLVGRFQTLIFEALPLSFRKCALAVSPSLCDSGLRPEMVNHRLFHVFVLSTFFPQWPVVVCDKNDHAATPWRCLIVLSKMKQFFFFFIGIESEEFKRL